MNKNFLVLGYFAFSLIACTHESGVGTVVLDVRCAADADCPGGFECEDEVEHGTEASYCVSDPDHATGECPAGYELEDEHGATFCKPHGGAATSGGAGTAGGECAASPDCAAGRECEVEVEHGLTTSVCKAHGNG